MRTRMGVCALACACVLGLAGSALAKDGGAYINLFGGATQSQDVSLTDQELGGRVYPDENYSMSTGWDIGVAGGGHVWKGLCVEGEFLFMNNSVSDLSLDSSGSSGTQSLPSGPSSLGGPSSLRGSSSATSGTQSQIRSVDGFFSAGALMINAVYDQPLTDWLSVYGGGGIGYGFFSLNTNFDTAEGRSFNTDVNGSTWAYQLKVGVAFKVAKTTKITVGYRMFVPNGTANADSQYAEGNISGTLSLPTIQAVEVGVRLDF